MSVSASDAISPVMQALSLYISEALHRPLPDDVAEKTKHHLLDTLAAMISGAKLEPGVATIRYIRLLGGVEESVVAGSDIVTNAVNAALANGMLAHADETDDSHKESRSHLGCGVVPAAWAMAEREESPGAALLRAVALGYDVGARTTPALGVHPFYDAGHSTHTFAPLFGSAAAAGALAGLTQEQCRWLLSYTAQQASGVNCWQRDIDHIEKAFDFGGMAARNGVQAATMVQSGMTGLDDVFSGPRNYFFTYAKEPNPDAMVAELGERFEIMHTNIKKWSVGSPIQAPLDCVEAMLAKRDFSADDVKEIRLTLAATEAAVVDDRHMADICLQHMVAIMILDKGVSFATAHDDERMTDADVRALREKMVLIPDEATPRRTASVAIDLASGETLSEHQDAVRGTPTNKMTRDEVEAKAYDLIAPVIGEENAQALITRIWEIEKVENVRHLQPLLMA